MNSNEFIVNLQLYNSAMKVCNNCGNEVRDSLLTCPHCRYRDFERDSARPRLARINIKEGMPTAEEAVRRLKDKVATCKRAGYTVLRVVHGYGSTGEGGKIREEARRELLFMKQSGIIVDFLPCENYSKSSALSARLLKKIPELEKDYRTDCNNPGATFVIFRNL